MKNLIFVTLLFATTAFATPPLPVVSTTIPATAIDSTVTVAQLCTKGYTAGQKADGTDVRHVHAADKNAVYAAAKVKQGTNPDKCDNGKGSPYEVDHRISLQLGGTNHRDNLTLQEYCGPYNAHDKDKLENYLHDEMLCKGKMTMKQVQEKIYLDWKAAYIEIFGP
jgi:hypothetical protein